MFTITDEHIAYILNDLKSKGIALPALRENLLDHICILIEGGLEDGGEFEAYYQKVIPSFYRQELRELEEETIFLLRHRGPRLLLGRTPFLFCLFVVMVGPFIGYDLQWLVRMGPQYGYRIPLEVWGGSAIFSLFPLLVWMVLALTPDRFDPLLPGGAKVMLGWRPFISVV
jgi:hypothetical protein